MCADFPDIIIIAEQQVDLHSDTFIIEQINIKNNDKIGHVVRVISLLPLNPSPPFLLPSLLLPLPYNLPPSLEPLLVQLPEHLFDELVQGDRGGHVLDPGPAHGALLGLLLPLYDALMAEGVAAVEIGGHDEDLHAYWAL